MKSESVPGSCPKCGASGVRRILWQCVHLFGEDQIDLAAGRAIFGSSSVPPADAPAWACVSCDPDWLTLSRLAFENYQWQIAKEEAVSVADFVRAGELRELQKNRHDALVTLVATLVERRNGQSSSPDPDIRQES